MVSNFSETNLGLELFKGNRSTVQGSPLPLRRRQGYFYSLPQLAGALILSAFRRDSAAALQGQGRVRAVYAEVACGYQAVGLGPSK